MNLAREENRPRARLEDMYSNPHTHLAIARARHEDMIRQADRDRLARSFEDERPGVVVRLRARLATRRHPQSRPVTAH